MIKSNFLLTLIFFSYFCQGQMRINGKITEIKNANYTSIRKSMTGEFGWDNGTQNFQIKIDEQGNFKMHYGITNKSRSFNTGTGGWSLNLKGTVRLVDADFIRRKEPIKDKYGDVENTNIYYTKYFAVFTGTDQNGREHSFCCTIDQMSDNKYLYEWKMNWTDHVPNCYCEDVNAPQSVYIPFSTTLN